MGICRSRPSLFQSVSEGLLKWGICPQTSSQRPPSRFCFQLWTAAHRPRTAKQPRWLFHLGLVAFVSPMMSYHSLRASIQYKGCQFCTQSAWSDPQVSIPTFEGSTWSSLVGNVALSLCLSAQGPKYSSQVSQHLARMSRNSTSDLEFGRSKHWATSEGFTAFYSSWVLILWLIFQGTARWDREQAFHRPSHRYS